MTTENRTHPGDKSAAELEREVEAQRAEVEDNIEALQDRLSPGQLMDQLFDYAKNGNGAEFTRNLGRSVRDNPMPVALIGAGMAWLMAGGQRAPYRHRSRYDDDLDSGWNDDWYDEDDGWDNGYAHTELGLTRTTSHHQHRSDIWRDDADDQSGGIGEKASELADKAGNMVDDLSDKANAAGTRARDAMRDAGDQAGRKGRRLRSDARRYRDEVGRRAGRYGRRMKRGFFDTLEDQPLVLGAIGIAVGAALGAALPATEREDEFMGETRDELKRRAQREGRRQMENARDVADAAYVAAKDEADSQDLTSESGKDAAGTLRDKATKVADAAADAAEKEAASKS